MSTQRPLPRPPARPLGPRPTSLDRVREMASEGEEFDPARPPTWRGSRHDLVLNGRRAQAPTGPTALTVGPHEARLLESGVMASTRWPKETWVVHEKGEPFVSVLQVKLYRDKGQWFADTSAMIRSAQKDIARSLAAERNNMAPNARSRGRKSDPSAWRQTPEAQAKYREARAYAQSKANEMGMDMGLEGNDVFKHWNVFGPLPKRENRSGHELRCEVVSPENIGSTQPGHGHAPNGRRPGRTATVGFTIYTEDERTIEDNARDKYGPRGDDPEARQEFLKEGLIDEEGQITAKGWEVLSADVGRLEENSMRWLRKHFVSAVDHGHDSRGDLVGLLTYDKANKKQREVVDLGREGNERIDMVDSSYGGLADSAFDGVSDFGGSLLGGAVTFEREDEPEARMARNSGSTRLHAQPYQDAAGFYFGSTEEFEAGMAKLNKRGIEEVEIQFIDGSKGDAELFAALKLSQVNVALWFDSIEGLEDHQKATLFHMATNGELYGQELDEVVEQIADNGLDEMANQGTLKELVEQWMDDDIIGGEQYVNYFDYDAFGHDLQVSGDLCGNEEDDEAREACEERWEGKSDYDIGYEWLDEVYGGVEQWWTQIQKQKKEARAIGHGSNSREERKAQEAEDNFKHFFNIDGFVRDVELNGDVNEFEWNGETWTIQRS
jgi:hypothetical protein